MKCFRKLLAIGISTLIFISGVLPASAATISNNDTFVSVSEVKKKMQETVSTEPVIEPVTEKTTIEAPSAVATIAETTQATVAEITHATIETKPEKSVTVTRDKKGIASSGASVSKESTGAASQAQATTYKLTGVKYTDSKGDHNFNTATVKIQRYTNTSTGNHQYTYTDSSGTHGKLYKIIFTFKATSSSKQFTATWDVTPSSLTSKTQDDSKGVLTVNCGSQAALPNFKEPTTDNNGNTTGYTPWRGKRSDNGSNAMTLSRITSVVIGQNVTSTGANTFRGLNACTSVTFDNGTNANNCTTIGEKSFYGLTALENVYFRKAPISKIGSQAFIGCTSLINSTVDGGDGSVKNPEGRTYNNDQIFTLPYTVKTIEERAFANCSRLEFITWRSNGGSLTAPSLTTIKYGAFRNCYKLYYFNIPNSCTTIEGTDSAPSSETSLLGAFYLDENSCTASDYPGYSFWIALEQRDSQLTYIGKDAFRRSVTSKTGKGIRIYNFENNAIVENSTKFTFNRVTKIGECAFMNNPEFTGIYQFTKYVNIGGRAFVNTNLTDLYFKWDPNKRVTSSMVTSSQIGSSNQHVSSSSAKGYTDSTYSPPSGYFSLYSILHDNSNGLFSLWATAFQNIVTGNSNFTSWSADIGNETPSQPSSVPELSYGNKNSVNAVNPKTNKNTHSYLKTKAEWTTINKTAKETVNFGYKNETKVDYVFVVDNSPSMDMAANSSGTSYQGTHNASKVMNEYAQIYDISKQVLGQGNTVSIVSFNGNDLNQLSASSKQLGATGMTTSTAVYNALFKNDNGYEDGGVTNYSAGLSRAYYLLQTLQKNNSSHEQVAIMMTDGHPTYTDDSKTVDVRYTDTSNLAKQVNGVDWAAAIRGTASSYTVRNYTTSKTGSYNNTTVSGLGVPIYGILVGSTDAEELNMVTSGNSANFTNTRSSEDIETLADALNDIIISTTSENYTVVIPIDDNFMCQSSGVTLSYSVDGKSYRYSMSLAETYKYPNTTSGVVKYDSGLNAVVWDFSTFSTSNLYQTSMSYVTYTLTFNLTCAGGGKKLTTNGMTYYAVNDNDPNTSKNAYAKNGSSYRSPIGSTLGTNYGAYAYIGTPKAINTSHNTVEETATVMNTAPSIYLPYYTGRINLSKASDSHINLANAEFKIYDENLNLVKLYKVHDTLYYFDPDGSTDTINSISYSSVGISDIPYGTYYLLETKYPDTDTTSYTESKNNKYVQKTINNRVENCIKFTVDSSSKSIVVYNTPVLKSSRITGIKYYLDGRRSGTVTQLVGATIALYDNYNNAVAGNDSYISTAITNRDGSFNFEVTKIGTYYIREIEAPEGYQLSNAIKSVSLTDLNKSVINVGVIYDFKLAEITVHVDSSDSIQQGFMLSLEADMSDVSSSPITYYGTSNGDGTYTFKVPLYYIYFNGRGTNIYKGISYTLKEIGYQGRDIPIKYIYQEYGLNSFSDVTKANSYSFTYKDWNEILWPDNEEDQYPAFTNPNRNIYVYNPSIRVTINNYDGTDRTTPLQSDFTLNDEVLRTNENGTVTSDQWFGFAGVNTITQTKVPEGYNLLSNNISFVLNSSSNLTAAYNDSGRKYYRYFVTIYNSKKTELPPLGGNGKLPYVLSGIFLITLCGGLTYLYCRVRRKKVE